MLWKSTVAAAVIILAVSGATLAKDKGGGDQGGNDQMGNDQTGSTQSGGKTKHDDKSNLPLCNGSAGQVENENCRMPN